MSQPLRNRHPTDGSASRRPDLGRSVLPLLLALLAAAPLWGPGIVNTRGGGDSPFLLQRTLEMAEILAHGIFPPRWMSHAAYDLGYPFFNHYAALPYIISGGLTALGLNVLSAIQATQTLGFLLAALTMRLWGERIFRSEAARTLAVAAYTFAPFHLVNIYVRGDSLSEFYAFIWYPLILWAVDHAAEYSHVAADSHATASSCARAVVQERVRRAVGYVLVGALAYGALILTHNVSALIFSPFALLYALVALLRHRPDPVRLPGEHELNRSQQRYRPIAAVLAPFVAGVLLTAWFWLPAITETRYGQMGPAFTEGYFHYGNHFRGLNLTQRSPAFDYSVAGTIESAGPFAMGFVQTLLTLAACVSLALYLVRRARTSGVDGLPVMPVAHLTALLVSTLMVTPLSAPLWAHVPLLALTQFPWRFLSVQALFAATVTGALAERRGRWVIAAPATAALIAAALVGLHPERLPITAEDVTWERLRFYEAFTGNIGTTIRYEYLPADVVPRLYTSEAVVDGGGSLRALGDGLRGGHLVHRTPALQIWRVETAGELTSVAFPLNAWPGWHAYLDDVETAHYAIEGSGRLTLDLPPGSHTVTLRLRPTPLQTGALALSLASALAVGFATVIVWRRSPPTILPQLRRLGAVTVMLGAALIGPVLLQRPIAGQATFFDFEQMPYPHRGPVAFGDGLLADAELSTSEAGPGERLELHLRWRRPPAEARTLTARVVSPAEPRHGVDYALAEVEAPVAGTDRLEIPLPEDLSRGLYLVELRLDDGQGQSIPPRTAGGRTISALYIGWFRVSQGAPLASVETLAQLEDIALVALQSEQQPGRLRLKLTWSLDPATAAGGTPRNWRLSLRVLDLDGRLLAQQDLQPGYGYLPTTLWEPGEVVVDYPVLELPEGLAPGDYTLRIVTYLQSTMRGGGEVDLPLSLKVPTLYDLRDACCELDQRGATILCSNTEVALLSLDRPASVEEGASLRLTAEWNALLAPTEDLQATWTLTGPDGGVVATTTAPLAPGSATSAWPRHTWVRSPVMLDLPQRMTTGEHALHLTLSSGGSDPIDCGPIAELMVTPRPRAFSAPDVEHDEHATFGDTLELLGYDLALPERRGAARDRLELTLWWRAAATPAQDFKRFVHLYDPATEAVLAQDDAMPRDWTYPTTLWVAGEVVSETIAFDLSGVAPGAYRIGLGWYDPETLDRLPATAADPAAVQADRLTLAPPITVAP